MLYTIEGKKKTPFWILQNTPNPLTFRVSRLYSAYYQHQMLSFIQINKLQAFILHHSATFVRILTFFRLPVTLG